MNIVVSLSSKVCGRYSVNFLNQTPIFDWCVVGWGSEKKHHDDACLKEFALRLLILLTTHSVVNPFRRTYVFRLWINRHALPITITKARDIQFCWCFTIDLLNPTQTWRLKYIKKKVESKKKQTKSHLHMFVTEQGIGRTIDRFIQGINRHTLPITITKTREIRFLFTFHHKFANPTQTLTTWHKSDQ